MAHIKITSISLSSVFGPTTASFSIAEDTGNAVYDDLGTVAVNSAGILATPIETGELVPNTGFKIKCVLGCGTSFIKHFVMPGICLPPDDLQVELQYNLSSFTGIRVLFTPVPGVTSYHLVVYKNAVPGDPGSVFVNSYDFFNTIGAFAINDFALLAKNVTYYVAIASECGGQRSEYSNFVSYQPRRISAVASGEDLAGERKITVTLDVAAPADITFNLLYKLTDGSIHSATVTVLSGNTSVTEVIGTDDPPAIDTDPSAFTILEAIPALVNNSYLIIF